MNKMNLRTAGIGVAIATLIAAAGSTQARADGSSDGSTPASGDTVVTMTVPKFATVQGIPANVGFTVTSAEYAAGTANNTALIGFKVCTNSTAGLTVNVAGDTSPTLQNGDIVLSSDDGVTAPLTLSTTAAPIWTNSTDIDQLPGSTNVNLGVQVNNLYHYTSSGASTYTNTLTFTVLPN